MKLSVEFPSVAYREGPEAVIRLARAIEEIGYDQLDVFDHVLMGYPTDDRPAPMYPAEMPILEALMTLSYAAAVTSRIGLGTEVLVLPQRQPVLVAKQISTLDTLSSGRVRLGIGVGWQASEFDALEEDFSDRGRRMDEAIHLMRAYWSDSRIDFAGEYYTSTAMAMEPKPPQGGELPIWIGGTSRRALRRVGELGEGWMAPAIVDPTQAAAQVQHIHRAAENAGRDPTCIGLQQMLVVPPQDTSGKAFYSDMDMVAARAAAVREMGFEWGAVNATAIFQADARSVDAIIDRLADIHRVIHRETA
ncbi:MAG: LLM class F420-dependent oxidoreductase [Pseudomonadales bacterium]|jgi:probable F420-dependent oxidoreductase|nr:LLM class F420-dependent oxidoreductase [Pseudomonadales bacterium]MDP6472480.1 LLM class F420-dependent oxidoreductase [Pseudomonadales bacterium]MDP6828709.1 LLM class F420-dependent oxidoreductase [Pseudomonadales bacterium]MDP6973310.1 LLM class F420-dependent oxidoreductase [Pseudomonadales bacterium]|tara:strand:+ start:568 stop:1482 length:915 start_codon:yes stop_codon:yes gene_type:complete